MFVIEKTPKTCREMVASVYKIASDVDCCPERAAVDAAIEATYREGMDGYAWMHAAREALGIPKQHVTDWRK